MNSFLTSWLSLAERLCSKETPEGAYLLNNSVDPIICLVTFHVIIQISRTLFRCIPPPSGESFG